MKCFTRWTMPLALALTMSVVFASSQAMGGIIEYTAPATVNARADGVFTIGNQFMVGSSNIVIDALGVHDYSPSGANGDGLFSGSSIQVGLWNMDGTVLHESVTMQTGSASTLDADGYRYEPLTSNFTLLANTTYLIGAVVGAGIEFFEDGGQAPPLVEPFSGNGITLLEPRFNSGSTLAAPLGVGSTLAGRWGAANARIVPIPEPTSLMLVGLGAIGLVGFGRRRK